MRTNLSATDASLVGGTPYWPIRDGEGPRYDSLRDEIRTDVAVVCGGITGALAAHRFLEADLEVALLDKGRFGAGSTSASTALISYEFDLLLKDLVPVIGEKSAIRAYELCYRAVCEFRDLVEELEEPCDYWDKVCVRISNLPHHAKEFEAEQRLRNRNSFRTYLVDRCELASKYDLAGENGLVCENAAQIDPLKLVRRIIRQGTKRGLRAFENSRVTVLEPGLLGTARGGTVRAHFIVFATGYESEKYLGRKLAALNTDYAFVSHPLRSLGKLEHCHVVEHAERYLYVSTFGKRVMAGVEHSSLHRGVERRGRLSAMAELILSRYGSYVPEHPINPEYRWAGTFAKSRDSLPYLIQAPHMPNCWFLLGYGGNGIASSATLAHILADLISKGKSRDADLFNANR